jgi:hypothetical protein
MRTGAILVFFAAILSGCASTVNVSDLKVIQDTRGFYTKSLYYTGSTRRHHHFDQFVLFDLGFWIPGAEPDGCKGYRVPREELFLPTDFEFKRTTYKGESDDRRRKIRIKDDPTYSVEKRKTAEEQLAEKYPDGIDLSKARVKQESDGTYVLILATSSATNETDNTTAQTTAPPSSGL